MVYDLNRIRSGTAVTRSLVVWCAVTAWCYSAGVTVRHSGLPSSTSSSNSTACWCPPAARFDRLQNRQRKCADVYNWHSAGSPGWPFPMLKYKYIFFQKGLIYTEAILSNGTQKLLWFEIGKMLIAVWKKYCVTYYNSWHIFVRPKESRSISYNNVCFNFDMHWDFCSSDSDVKRFMCTSQVMKLMITG